MPEVICTNYIPYLTGHQLWKLIEHFLARHKLHVAEAKAQEALYRYVYYVGDMPPPEGPPPQDGPPPLTSSELRLMRCIGDDPPCPRDRPCEDEMLVRLDGEESMGTYERARRTFTKVSEGVLPAGKTVHVLHLDRNSILKVRRFGSTFAADLRAPVPLHECLMNVLAGCGVPRR